MEYRHSKNRLQSRRSRPHSRRSRPHSRRRNLRPTLRSPLKRRRYSRSPLLNNRPSVSARCKKSALNLRSSSLPRRFNHRRRRSRSSSRRICSSSQRRLAISRRRRFLSLIGWLLGMCRAESRKIRRNSRMSERWQQPRYQRMSWWFQLDKLCFCMSFTFTDLWTK